MHFFNCLTFALLLTFIFPHSQQSRMRSSSVLSSEEENKENDPISQYDQYESFRHLGKFGGAGDVDLRQYSTEELNEISHSILSHLSHSGDVVGNVRKSIPYNKKLSRIFGKLSISQSFLSFNDFQSVIVTQDINEDFSNSGSTLGWYYGSSQP